MEIENYPPIEEGDYCRLPPTPTFPILPFGNNFHAALIFIDGGSVYICRAKVTVEKFIADGFASIRQLPEGGFDFRSDKDRTAFCKTLETLNDVVPILPIGDSIREKDARQLIELARRCPYKYPTDLSKTKRFFGLLWYLRQGRFDREMLAFAEESLPRFAKRLKKKHGSGLSKTDVVFWLSKYPEYQDMTASKLNTKLRKIYELVDIGILSEKQFQELNLKVIPPRKSYNKRKPE